MNKKMKRLGVLLLTLAFISSTSICWGMEIMEEPSSENLTTNEAIENYNLQVDQYNEFVEGYNEWVDNEYEKASEDYNKEVEEVTLHNEKEAQKEKDIEEANKKEEERVEEAIQHNNEEKEKVKEVEAANAEETQKVEENKAALEKQEQLNQKIEKFKEKGLENSTTDPEGAPSTFEVTQPSETKTIKVEKSETPSEKTYNVTNVHLYVDEEAGGIYYGTWVEDNKFLINPEMLAHMVLVEWETTNVNENDTVTVVSEARQMGYSSAAFYRYMEGYTNGYWLPTSELVTTAVYTDTTTWGVGGQQISFSYEDGSTDNKGVKNTICLWTYNFMRYGPEPEKVEPYEPNYQTYEPDYWDTEYHFQTYIPNIWELPMAPVKDEHLKQLSHKDLLEEETVEEPTEEVETEETEEVEEIEKIEEAEKVEETKPTPQSRHKRTAPVPTPTPTQIIRVNTIPAPTVEEVIEEQIETFEKEQKEETSELPERSVPQSAPTQTGAWALINLIATLLMCILTILLLISAIINRVTKEEDEKVKNKMWLRIIAGLLAIVAIIIFILTENIWLPMILIDKWTWLMVVLLLIQVCFVILSRRKIEKTEQE